MHPLDLLLQQLVNHPVLLNSRQTPERLVRYRNGIKSPTTT